MFFSSFPTFSTPLTPQLGINISKNQILILFFKANLKEQKLNKLEKSDKKMNISQFVGEQEPIFLTSSTTQSKSSNFQFFNLVVNSSSSCFFFRLVNSVNSFLNSSSFSTTIKVPVEGLKNPNFLLSILLFYYHTSLQIQYYIRIVICKKRNQIININASFQIFSHYYSFNSMDYLSVFKPRQHSQSRKHKYVRVYFQRKPSVRVNLKFRVEEVQDLTIQEFVKKIIYILKCEYLLGLSERVTDFSLYSATKSGQKKRDLPQFEGSQNLRNVKFYRFYIQQIFKSDSKISSGFNLNKKYGIQKVDNNNPTCCRLFEILH